MVRRGETRIIAIDVVPLLVPLVDPFVIATARVDHTTSVEVCATVERDGARFRGFGEGAALHPVTREAAADLAPAIEAVREALVEQVLDATLGCLDGVLLDKPVARAALEQALLDAFARAMSVPLYELLEPTSRGAALVTDITLPILAVERMAELARMHRKAGFTAFKVKVGKDLDADLRALFAVAEAVPDATYRLDANAAFSATDALSLLRALSGRGLAVECFEQPCPADDLDAMARVTRDGGVPVIADESVHAPADVARLVAHRAANGVNLKRVKSGGILPSLEVARAARGAGMSLMVGAMVETWLGLLGMAHLAVALGGVDFVDLDTAFLLRDDPFETGLVGPHIELPSGPGTACARRSPP